MRMYDNIRLLITYPFRDEPELNEFCRRFGIYVKDEKKGILHNKGYETLEQNRGIYIKIELPTEKRRGTISLSFSLHKFFNTTNGNGLYNFNDFTFSQANAAYKKMIEIMPFDISKAVVKKYEVGVNVTTKTNPDDYMKELHIIMVRDRKMRILEDLHYKEYKQYSTHKDRGKRIVYIFYNKTFEARSKTKDPDKKKLIPDNILRVEKDNKRPFEKVFFSDLFTPYFQQLTKNEFKKRFTESLIYKTTPIKSKQITAKQLELWKMLKEKGREQTFNYIEHSLNSGSITREQYRYRIKMLNEIIEKNIKPELKTSEQAKELKRLIESKIKQM